MEDSTPKVPITQEVQSEVKDVSQTPQQPPVVPQIPSKPTPPAKPKKKRLKLKIIIILIIVLVGLVLGGFFIWKNFYASKAEVGKNVFVTEAEKIEEEIYIYKGIWSPVLLLEDPNYLASNMVKFKDLGINTIFIGALPPLDEPEFEKIKEVFSPELVERVKEIIPIEKELIINIIQTAHKNGLRVALTVGDPPAPENIDLEAINSKIVEVAKLAEENDVELFAPLNEPGRFFGKNTGRWRQEILSKIKKVYHGEIVWKGAGVGVPDKATISKIPEYPPGDFVGYDYIGFSSMFHPSEDMTLEEYSQYVDGALDYQLALAERDGCKGVIISEFGLTSGGSLSEEEITRVHEIVLEKGKDRAVGFFALTFFLGVDLPGMVAEEDLMTEEVIREWFTEILPEKKLISY